MWCLMVLNAIALIQSAQGGYEYPKPSIRFELPNRGELQEEILKENKIDHKTAAYSLSYDNYQNLQQHNNEESSHGIVGTDGSVQHNLEINIKQVQPHILSTQLNTNINTAVSIHNGVSHNSAISESDSINIQPGQSANYPQLVLNIKNKVPPLVNLLSSEYIQNVQESSGVNNFDIQNVASLEQKNNIPPLVKLNINQGSSINENVLSQSINLAGVEQQLSDYSSDFQQSPPLQNVNNVIETIVSPIINLQESVPQVLNSQNNVQSTSFSGVLNIDEQVSNNQDNQILLPNSNYEQAQILNIQSSQAGQNGELNFQNNQQNIVSPVVTKSITFHVPPPDIEETSVIPAIIPPKKIYKIIFIKAPTFDYEYNQQLQTALYSRLAPVEDKTIIYVLTKKPELLTEQGIQPQPTKVSEHEVFYVKYKGDQSIDSEREGINESISQLPLDFSGDAAIEPRVTVDH